MTTGGVGDLASGRTKQPRFESGQKLTALYQRECVRGPKVAA
jgi:hypothetical protein